MAVNTNHVATASASNWGGGYCPSRKVGWHLFRDMLSVRVPVMSKWAFFERQISCCGFHWSFLVQSHCLVQLTLNYTLQHALLSPCVMFGQQYAVSWPHTFYSYHNDVRGSKHGLPASLQSSQLSPILMGSVVSLFRPCLQIVQQH